VKGPGYDRLPGWPCHTDLVATSEKTQIAVVGLGYVGCVTAACFAHLGHRVVGLDRDEFKVNAVLNGRAPFYEPGLESLVAASVSAGRLSASTSPAEALEDAELVFLCVGTPSDQNGNLNLEQLRRASAEIAPVLAGHARNVIVAIRSTVFPGTCEELTQQSFSVCPAVSVVCNPEFLREGNAVRDFLEPSLVVVGGTDAHAVSRVGDLYRPICSAPCEVSLRAAEMIKYACNAFHALKISFANEIGALCGKLGVSGAEVMEILCHDHKLNISPAYLKPGFAFGGSCLPKDLRAMTYRSLRLDLKLPLLESVLPSNLQHLDRVIQSVLALPVQRVGVFGLAFKADTDDLRESPVVTLVEQLLGKGREVRIFDPHIRLDWIYGSNKNFLLTALPHISKSLETGLDPLLAWAQVIVTTQQPSPESADKLLHGEIPVLDVSGLFSMLCRTPVST
jgi:GDP-mannose 6-dehydrogenase